MPENVIFVVGDNLASRSHSVDLVPLSRLEALLDGELTSGSLPVIVPGQGVEEYEREILRGALRRYGLPESLLADVPLPAPIYHSEVHKRNPDNVLIAGLRRISDDQFEAVLRISDRQEMVLDHTTGSHIAGMVITEVVRQISLAVGERYLLTPSRTPRRFILNSLQTSFHKFLLPLPARLEYTLEEVKYKGLNRVRFVGRCDVLQTNVLAASGSMDLVVMDESRADEIEARQIHEMTHALAELQLPKLQETEECAARTALSRTAAS
ncbi:AfsA-related hotdog domain-containing protein [Streptomyces sp. NEAU-174]|uniref:A-factor biosynthesis protein AfsA n=1 Tax=Streptomyces rhizosphaericus TaxID=114699 RepID=A0A6G4AWQ6_9ACTN|nr:A-factor biosynthesis protein AfsA [Streptomyces rhizosphaericus]